MNKMKLVITISLMMVFLSCATAKFVTTGNVYPPYDGSVRIFFDAPPDSIVYEEIGIISSQGGAYHQWAHLIEVMQKKAAKKGANAIIIKSQDKDRISTLTYNQQYGFMGSSGNMKNMLGIAIRIKK